MEHEDGRVVAGNGQVRFIRWHNRFRQDREGSIIGTLSSGLDVTERHRAEEDKEVRIALTDAQNRIMAMALVHNMLYSSEQLASIDLRVYIEELARGVIAGYGSLGMHVIQSLVADQLRGTFELIPGSDGFRARVSFLGEG